MVLTGNALTHLPACTRERKIYCFHAPVLEALCLLPTESKEGENQQFGEGQPFCMPGSLLNPQGKWGRMGVFTTLQDAVTLKISLLKGLGMASVVFAEAVTGFAASPSPTLPITISPMTPERHSCLALHCRVRELDCLPSKCCVHC